MQSQALETIQDRLRESETALRREQDSYRQMQVPMMSFILLYDLLRPKTWKFLDVINNCLSFCRMSIPAVCPK